MDAKKKHTLCTEISGVSKVVKLRVLAPCRRASANRRRENVEKMHGVVRICGVCENFGHFVVNVKSQNFTG